MPTKETKFQRLISEKNQPSKIFNNRLSRLQVLEILRWAEPAGVQVHSVKFRECKSVRIQHHWTENE